MGDLTSSAFEPFLRPLTEAERRALGARVRTLKATSRRASRAYLPLTGGVVLVLWVLTLLASDTAWPVITAFWLIVGGGIWLWVRPEMRQQSGQMEAIVRSLESGLKRNTAEVYDVRARAFAELEEIEDEGACYAFEIEGDRLLFISGQEFYEGARFPSLDFSLVYVLDEHGQSVHMFIDKRGAKAVPSRRISGAVKRTLDLPDHLEMRMGRIDNLENCIGPALPESP